MAAKSQHVVPKGDGWAVKAAGSTRATKVFDTQRDAINAARRIAQNQQAELIVHGRDGRIRDKRSYGNDPFPPRDKR